MLHVNGENSQPCLSQRRLTGQADMQFRERERERLLNLFVCQLAGNRQTLEYKKTE